MCSVPSLGSPSLTTSSDLRLAKAKAHVIFSDLDISSEHVVYLNVYQNFLLAAMKMREYLREAVAVKRNTAFIRSKSW